MEYLFLRSTLLSVLPFLCVGFWPSDGSNRNRPNLSPDELISIASLNLCTNFLGTCNPGCSHYIVHRWRLPLCENMTWKCCIRLSDYGGVNVLNETTTVMTTTISATTPTTTSATTPTTTAAPLADILPAPDACGQTEWARRRKRIVGGSVSAPGAWPWLVGFRSLFGAHLCSGALIAQRWVVTAAHCFRRFSLPSAWRLKVGEHNLLEADENEREIRISQIFVYPGFRTQENSTLYARYKHDLALVQLSEDAQAEPICLPWGQAGEPQNPSAGGAESNLSTQVRLTNLEGSGECWVAGWGSTRDNGSRSQVLREVQGRVIDSGECSSMWGTQLESDMICFGNGTYGPCKGDSGSPMSCQLGGQWYLGGVVSWGTDACNISGYPSVLTRLTPFLPWIQDTLIQHHQ